MADTTNAQRQARWRQRQKARNAELQKQAQAQTAAAPSGDSSDEALRNALKQAKARNTDLQCEVLDLRRSLNQAEGTLKRLQAASAKPKRPPKPPLDPDSQLARALKANRSKHRASRRGWAVAT